MLRQGARPLQSGVRYFTSSSRLLQDEASAPKPANSSGPSTTVNLAALQRVVNRRGDSSQTSNRANKRGPRTDDRGGAGRRNRGQEGATLPRDRGNRQRKPSVLSTSRPRQGSSQNTEPSSSTARTLPVLADLVPQTDWNRFRETAEPFSRVPYGKPPYLDLDLALKAQKNKANIDKYPLRTAERALTLHVGIPKKSANGVYRGNVLGPIQRPTPIAREGFSKGDQGPASTIQNGAKDTNQLVTSVKQEGKALRMRLLDERVGGDYGRWKEEHLIREKEATDSSQGSSTARMAADALSKNSDLGPVSRSWTLDVVRRIVSDRDAGKASKKE